MSTEKIEADKYKGVVFWPNRPGAGDYEEGFFSSVEKLLEICARLEISRPSEEAPAYACEPMHLRLNAADILERALEVEGHPEEAIESLSIEGNKALADFVEDWNAKYGVEVTSYLPNEDKILVF